MSLNNRSNVVYETFDPERTKFAPYGFKCERWSGQVMPWPDQHNELELNYLYRGSITYLLGSKKVTLEAGKLGVFWAANPHQIVDYEPGTTYSVATIPLEKFFRWRLPSSFVQSLMLGNLLSEPTADWSENDSRMFRRWEREEERMHSALMLEIQARLTRMAIKQANLDLRQSNEQGKRANELITSNSWLKVTEMALFIAQNYTKKIAVDTIASHVDLHPNYAMKLFQDTIGTTLLSYLTQYRVSHAQRLLATTNESITEIAYLSGFQSISRFNSIFLSASSCSPRDYRRTNPYAVV